MSPQDLAAAAQRAIGPKEVVTAAGVFGLRDEGGAERTVVAVTERAIHVLSLGELGGDPLSELASFDRVEAEIEVTKSGLRRTLSLKDPRSGHDLGLTGSAAPFSSVAKGDRAVLAALS